MKYEKGTFVVIPNIKQLEGKSPVLQTIYMWICYYSNQEGLCFPSQKTLAEKVGVSNNTLKTYLQELEKLGLLCRERRYKDNQEITSMYQLLIGGSTIEGGVGQPLREGVSNFGGGVGQPLPTELNVSLTKSIELNLSEELEKILTYWNSKYKLKNRLTNNLVDIYKKVRKNYKKEDIELGVGKYTEYISKNDFYKHRFSLYDFLKQGNGFEKFFNM